ncbi:MAG: hypothetical protein HY287_16340 [Planctomycetes bacterium]|nr:hypothetical protein [Planctomycetota bacterium]
MSRSPHAFLLSCAICLTHSVFAVGGQKPVPNRSTPTGPRVIRIAIGGGTLVFERTADSSTLRGQPQHWIALWQSSAKAPFYVFGQVLQTGGGFSECHW